jgi:hypothetical protein
MFAAVAAAQRSGEALPIVSGWWRVGSEGPAAAEAAAGGATEAAAVAGVNERVSGRPDTEDEEEDDPLGLAERRDECMRLRAKLLCIHREYTEFRRRRARWEAPLLAEQESVTENDYTGELVTKSVMSPTQMQSLFERFTGLGDLGLRSPRSDAAAGCGEEGASEASNDAESLHHSGTTPTSAGAAAPASLRRRAAAPPESSGSLGALRRTRSLLSQELARVASVGDLLERDAAALRQTRDGLSDYEEGAREGARRASEIRWKEMWDRWSVRAVFLLLCLSVAYIAARRLLWTSIGYRLP